MSKRILCLTRRGPLKTGLQLLFLLFWILCPQAAEARDIPCGPGEKLCDGICIPENDPCGGGNDNGGGGGEPSLEEQLAGRVEDARRSLDRIQDSAGGLSSDGIAESISKSGDLLEEIEAAEAGARQSLFKITALINEYSGWEAEQQEEVVRREYEQTGSSIGDPVRPAIGAYHMEITDMSFPYFSLSVGLRRRYQSGCPGSSSFGPGWFCSWDSRIYRCSGPDAAGLAAAVGEEQQVLDSLAGCATDLRAELRELLLNDAFEEALSTAEAVLPELKRRLRSLIEELEDVYHLAFGHNYRQVKADAAGLLDSAAALLQRLEDLDALIDAVPGTADGDGGAAELSRLSQAAREHLERVRAESAYAASAEAANPSVAAAADPGCYEHAGLGCAVLIDEDGVPRLYRFSEEPRVFSVDGSLTGSDGFFPGGCALVPVSGTGDRLGLREDGSYLLEKKDGRSLLYDGGGRLQQISDRSGNRVLCSYDERGRLIRVSDGAGRSIEIERSGGRLKSARGPDGAAVEYTYDAEGRLQSAAGPEGRLVSYEYGPGGLCRIVKPDGAAVEIEYTLTGGRYRVTLVRDENGAEESFIYYPGRRRTRYTDKSGLSIDHYWDERQQVVRSEYPDGSFSSRAYNEMGRQVERRDRSGATTRYRYDVQGNCIETRGPGDFHETAFYDENGLLLRSCDSRGSVTTYRYSARGNLLEINRPDGGRERMGYDEEGFLIRFTDARNCVYRYERDKYGNRTGVIHPDGGRSSYAYDLCGRLLAETGPGGGTTRYRYSSAGLLLEIRGPEGGTETFEYDERRDLRRYRDAEGGLRLYEYDDCHRLIGAEGPGDKSISLRRRSDGKAEVLLLDGRTAAEYEYDGEGRCTGIRYPGTGIRRAFRLDREGRITAYIDPKGLDTRYAYDKRGRLTSVRSPSGGFRRFEYDGNSNIIRYTDENGTVFSFYYDAADRLIEYRGPYGTSIRYGYDAAGNCVSIRRSPETVVRMECDCMNRVIEVQYPGGGKESFRYDKAGRITSLCGRSGGEWHFDYDRAGRLTAARNPLGAEEAFAYDARGLLVSYTDGCGALTRIEYDEAGRPEAYINAAGCRTEYRFGNRNELLTYRDGAGRCRSFEYDLLLRLTAETDPEGRRKEYRYDKNGNRVLSRDETGAEERWEYRETEAAVVYSNADGERIVSRYDSGGRLIREESAAGVRRSFSYDALGRVTREEDAGGSCRDYLYDAAGGCSEIRDADGETIRIEYDAAGRPVRFVYSAGGEKRMCYDNSGRITAARSGESRLTYRYDLLGRLISAGEEGGLYRLYEYDACGRPVRIIDNGPDGSVHGESRFSYGPDGLLRRLEDCSGRKIEFRYDPSGKEVLRSIDDTFFVRRFYGLDGRLTGFRASFGDAEARRDIRAAEVYLYDACGRKTRAVTLGGDQCSFAYSPGGRLVSAAYPLSSGKAAVEEAERLRLFGAPGYQAADGNNSWGRGLSNSGGGPFSPANLSRLTGEYSPLSAEEAKLLADRSREVFGPRKASDMEILPVRREEFAYDLQGNRIYKDNPLGRIEYRCGDGGILLQAGNCSFSYDEAGRLLLERGPGGDRRFTYNHDGRLSLLQLSSGGVEGRSICYGYDALGRRCLREEYRAEGGEEALISRTRFFYNGQSVSPARLERQVPADFPGPHETALRKAGREAGSRYRPPEQPDSAVPADREVPAAAGAYDEASFSEEWSAGRTAAAAGLPAKQPAGTAYEDLRIVYAAGEPLLYCSGGRSFMSLGTGSPCYARFYDAEEERVVSRFYDCFGNTPSGTSGSEGGGAGIIEENNLINYNGKMLDPVSGYYDTGFRDYRPDTGRFLTPDPLRTGGGYAYAAKDPVNRRDPDGLAPIYSSDVTGLPVSAYPGRDLKAAAMIDIVRSGRRGGPEEGWYHDRIQLRVGMQVLCDSPVQATADHPLLNSSPDRMGGDLAAGIYRAQLYTVIWKYKNGIQIIDDYLIHPDRFTLDSLYGRPGCGPWKQPYSLGCATMKIEDFDVMTEEIEAMGFVYRDSNGDKIPVRVRGRKYD